MQFSLKREPFWRFKLWFLRDTPSFRTLFYLGCGLMGLCLAQGLPQHNIGPQRSLMVVALVFGNALLLLLLWLRRVVLYFFPLPAVMLTESCLIAPAHSESLGPLVIDYQDMMAISFFGQSGRHEILIESTHHQVHLHSQLFADSRAFFQFIENLQQALHPYDTQASLRMETQKQRNHTLKCLLKLPHATLMILAVLLMLFINTTLKNAQATPWGLYRWGALYPALWQLPSWYRLFSNGFLFDYYRYGFGLLTLHMLALWHVGRFLEALWGKKQLVLFFLSGALSASIFGLLRNHSLVVVGPLPGILSIVGALWTTQSHWRQRLMVTMQKGQIYGRGALVMLSIASLFSTSFDLYAALMALATGSGLAYLFILLDKHPTFPSQTVIMLLSTLLGGLYVVGIVAGIGYAATISYQQEQQLPQRLLSAPHMGASALNEIAENMLAMETLESAEHQQIDQALERSLQLEPMATATLLLQSQHQAAQKKLAEAITLLATAIEKKPILLFDPSFAWEMARLLNIRQQTQTTPLQLCPHSTSLPQLEWDQNHHTIVLSSPKVHPPWVLYGLIMREQRAVGMLQIAQWDESPSPMPLHLPWSPFQNRQEALGLKLVMMVCPQPTSTWLLQDIPKQSHILWPVLP